MNVPFPVRPAAQESVHYQLGATQEAYRYLHERATKLATLVVDHCEKTGDLGPMYGCAMALLVTMEDPSKVGVTR